MKILVKFQLLLMAAALSVRASVNYPIVDTGQTTFYSDESIISKPDSGDAFYGQDAQYVGNQPSYTNNGDGTITDNVTGLMWQQDMGEKITFEEAFVKADTLRLANYNDWRVPTIKELYSLILFTGRASGEKAIAPFIDTMYFNQPLGDVTIDEREIDAQTWSSTQYVGRTMRNNETVFGVNFVDGRIKGYPKYKPATGAANKMYFRMVRGNPDYGKNSFVDNGDGTITDLATGLMWQKADDGIARDWQQALAYAESADLAGHSDWRLPNAKELQSIVDYTRSPQTTNSPAIDPIFETTGIKYPDGSPGHFPFFWTGTTHLDGRNPYASAVYVAFGEGLGQMNGIVMDVHGAGCQRSDPKSGNIEDYPQYWGPQGDIRYVYNYVRLVRDADSSKNVGGNDTSEATLFAPLGQTTTYLIDSVGEVINSWQSRNAPGLAAYLLPDKSLLRTSSLGRNGNAVFSKAGGAGGRVERFDWDGNKVWEFEYNSDLHLLHHDIEYLPNGNILMIAWDYRTGQEAIQAGRNPALLADGALWPDQVIEVEPAGASGGTIVWQWKVWDHLVQDFDPRKENYGNVADHPEKININFVDNRAIADWNHVNAVDYNAELDQILLTSRSFSEVWIINHNTTTEEAAGSAGDLLYRWGNPQSYGRGTESDRKLFGPHDGRWIETTCPGAGDILVFNNGKGRPGGNYSTIEEITPPLAEDGSYSLTSGKAFGPAATAWFYQASPATEFYSDHIGGAQRLANGNTLICNGTSGAFFEVTESGETVWEYKNPYTFTNPQGETKNEVFRAVRYNLDDLGGGATVVSEQPDQQKNIPSDLQLQQNYPNPFNPETTIAFYLPTSNHVSLKIYNTTGQLISTLVDEKLSRGDHQLQWNALNMPSGIYFYNLRNGPFSQTKRMILLK